MNFYTDHPDRLPLLIESMFSDDYPANFYHAWIWDGLIRRDIRLVNPFLEEVVSRLLETESESVIRILAKTCEIVSEELTNPAKLREGPAIGIGGKEKIISACFEWLQEDHKVAPKVFAMTTLWNLRREASWIEEALLDEIHRQLPIATAGFKNRSLKILARQRKESSS